VNQVKQFFWKLLSTDKFNDFSSLAVKTPGPISKKAAQDACAKEVLSVREDGANSGTFVERYLSAVGLDAGNPWCMAFVVLRLVKAAHSLALTIPNEMPRTGSTVLFSNFGKRKTWWIKRADLELGRARIQEGDIVFYFFAAKGRIAHTGIVVEADSNKDFKTVEGNTSSGLRDVVDRDGQGVYMKQRSISSLGLFGGVVRLPY
jgi:hypothetical protein